MAYSRFRNRRYKNNRSTRVKVYRKRTNLGEGKVRLGKPQIVMSNQLHSFKRQYHNGLWDLAISGTPVQTFGAIEFKLSDLATSINEYTALFDRYKLNAVKVTWVIGVNCAYEGSGGSFLPRIHTAIDYDDSNPPLTLDDLMQYTSYKMSSFTGSKLKISRYIKPRMAGLVYKSGISNAYSVLKPSWVDLTSADVPHYGIKYCIETGGANGTAPPAATLISQYRTYYFQVRDVR